MKEMGTTITTTEGAHMVPPQILIIQLQERIKHLEDGHKRIVAESHKYVLNKHKASDRPIHEFYRRISKHALRETTGL